MTQCWRPRVKGSFESINEGITRNSKQVTEHKCSFYGIYDGIAVQAGHKIDNLLEIHLKLEKIERFVSLPATVILVHESIW